MTRSGPEVMEQNTTLRWAALYESAAERASQAESKIRSLEERVLQLEQQVLDWKAVALGCQTTYGRRPSHTPQ